MVKVRGKWRGPGAAVLSLILSFSLAYGKVPDVSVSFSTVPKDFATAQTETMKVAVRVVHPDFENGDRCAAKSSWTTLAADFVALYEVDSACEYDEEEKEWQCSADQLLSRYTGNEWIQHCDRDEQMPELELDRLAIHTIAEKLREESNPGVVFKMRAMYCKNDRAQSWSDMLTSSGYYTCLFASENEVVVSSEGRLASRAVCNDIKGKGMQARCKIEKCAVKEWWEGRKIARGPSRITCEESNEPRRGLEDTCRKAEDRVKVPKVLMERIKPTILANGNELLRQTLRDVPFGTLGTYDAVKTVMTNWRDPNKSNGMREAAVLSSALLFLIAKNTTPKEVGSALGVAELSVGALLSPQCLQCMRTVKTLKTCLSEFMSRTEAFDNSGNTTGKDSAGLACSSQFFIILLTGLDLSMAQADGKPLTVARPMSIFGVESWKSFKKKMMGRLIYSAALVGAFTYAYYDPNDAITLSHVAYAKIGFDTAVPIIREWLKQKRVMSVLGGAFQGMLQRGKGALCYFVGCTGGEADGKVLDALIEEAEMLRLGAGSSGAESESSAEDDVFDAMTKSHDAYEPIAGLSAALLCPPEDILDFEAFEGGDVLLSADDGDVAESKLEMVEKFDDGTGGEDNNVTH